MKRLCNAIAVFVAASTVTAAAAQPKEISPPADAEVLDIEHERYERFTVPVTIGESGPYRFMIDTGAQATVLGHHIADELALHDRRPATLIGMASRRPIETVEVEDLGLGSRVFNIQSAPIVPRANIGGADGILGLDSLQHQRVLLDFQNRTIAVADAETLGGNRGYEIIIRARRKLGQLLIAHAEIDGVSTSVIVDTGAQGSMGNMALKRRLRPRGTGTAVMTDINGVESENTVHMVNGLLIGRAEITDFPLIFADSPPFEALGLKDKPALILGIRELQLFNRVAIDFHEGKVLFDAPNHTRVRKFPRNVRL